MALGIYFDAATIDESEIRTLADALYRRADWQWAQNQGATLTHGWKSESGFLTYRHCIHQAKMTQFNSYGFKASFNPSHPGNPGNPYGWWVSPHHFGLNQGPIILMIENYRTGFIWELMKRCPYLVTGLRRAGFTNGWL